MRAGLLTEEIKIHTPITLKNEYGEEDIVWENTYTTKARLVHLSGGRTNENSEIFYNYIKVFECRIFTPVGDFDRIEWDGKMFRILDIEPNRDQMKITIKTELIND